MAESKWAITLFFRIFLLKINMAKKVARDLLVYFALCALPIASFLLAGYGETQFYVSLLVVSLLVIVWFRLYYKEADQIVDYDENLDITGMGIVLGGTIGVLLLTNLIVGVLTKSLIYIPTHKLGLEYGQIIVPSFWSDVLFQLTLVSPSEECTKLAVMLALYLWFRDKIGKDLSTGIAVGAAVGGWAFLHTFRNPAYMGQYGVVMVLGAFIAGLVMFLVMKYKKSLLASILIHAFYNTIVLYFVYNV
jgi:membrane protease YdiL (CAAX protease family)